MVKALPLHAPFVQRLGVAQIKDHNSWSEIPLRL